MDEVVKKQRGGVREGSGRKSKAEELSLIEKLSPLEESAFTALTKALLAEKDWAVKLFFQYQFGMPKQVVDQHNTHDINTFSINEVFKIK